MKTRKVMLVLAWSPGFQGGVTGVVQQLIAHWGDEQLLSPMLVVDDWESKRAVRKADATYFCFTALGAVPIIRLPRALLRLPVALWRTWRLLRQEQVGAVNFHYTDHSPWGIAVLKRFGLYRGKLLISFHGTDVRAADSAMDHWLRTFAFRHADAMVACSTSLADRMALTFGIDRSAIQVIQNGVDTETFRGDATQTPSLGRLPERYVVSIGAFVPRKAHGDLIQAFALAFKHDSALHLCLAGADGSTLSAERQQAVDLGIEQRVHFFVGLGPAEVAHLLARAQLFVLPSLAESMPLAVLEAGAVGVPVAVSSIPGHDELIIDGQTGRLFAVGNPRDCAKVLEEMFDVYEDSLEQARRLQQSVRNTLTWDTCVQRYKALYGQPQHSPTAKGDQDAGFRSNS